MTTRHQMRPIRPSLTFILLSVLFVALWMAGGASRADALGQVVVRAVAAMVLVIALIAGPRPSLADCRPVLLLLLATIGLVLCQLVPLPPDMWQSLPGRNTLSEAVVASGQAQSWRPVALVPDAAINAVSSLIVPLVVLLLVSTLGERERTLLPAMALSLVTASTILGLLQFSGAGFNNPFINDGPGEVGGSFANRNHFALFLGLGCLLAPAWAFWNGRRPGWRVPVALGLLVLFVLTILASGSRAGLLIGGLASALGLVLVRNGIRRELRGAPRWVFASLLAGIVALVLMSVLLSVAADRAVSVDRALALVAEEDLRAAGMPIVLSMIRGYFPIGSGAGSFDAVFRMVEPAGFLSPSYFNHAHNDILEVVLDGSVAGGLLLLVAAGWWLFATVRAWRVANGPALLGSAMLLLIVIASIVDYPARTPMIMAMVVLPAMWLSTGGKPRTRSALPSGGRKL